MMKVEVKLYSYHDMDLVGLYKTGKVSFPETTRQVLNSYARGEVYKVKLLHTNEKRLAKYPKTSFRKYYHYHVMLDGKDDADAISLLHKITPGYRNNFIKVVLRQYLCGVFLEEYCTNGDTSFFNEMSRKFQGERDEREIKQTKKEKNEYVQIKIDDSEKTRETVPPITDKDNTQAKNQPFIDRTVEIKIKKDEKKIGTTGSEKEDSLNDKKYRKKSGTRNSSKFKNEVLDSRKPDEPYSNNRDYTQETDVYKPVGKTASDDFKEHNSLPKDIPDSSGHAAKFGQFDDEPVSISIHPSDDGKVSKTISASSYDDEDDDFDDFLDEMTEQY